MIHFPSVIFVNQIIYFLILCLTYHTFLMVSGSMELAKANACVIERSWRRVEMGAYCAIKKVS